MTLKHVLKHFSKTEVQEDERFTLAPMREREELLCERSELSNSGEGYISCAEHTVKNLFTYLPIHLFTFKKCAFTLAEVLITLGIIGVVAALTLPTLIQNHQKQTYVTGLKKAYANIQNAFAKMAYDEGVTDWSQTYCGELFAAKQNEMFGNSGNTSSDLYGAECYNRIKNQFKIAKEGLPNNFRVEYSLEVNTAFITTDGSVYVFECSGSYPSVDVDINGTKGPNKAGRDQFAFYIRAAKNKIEPFGVVNFSGNKVETWKNCSGTNLSVDCTAKVLIEGKMDY